MEVSSGLRCGRRGKCTKRTAIEIVVSSQVTRYNLRWPAADRVGHAVYFFPTFYFVACRLHGADIELSLYMTYSGRTITVHTCSPFHARGWGARARRGTSPFLRSASHVPAAAFEPGHRGALPGSLSNYSQAMIWRPLEMMMDGSRHR